MTNVCLEKIEKATLNKVKCYIKKMYKDALVQKTAVLAMRDFGICCGFYDNYKKKFNKTENLYEILNFLKEEQINQISKDKKLVKDLNRKIIKDSVDEKLPATDSDGAVMAVSEIDNVAMYFRHSIENCLNGTSYIFQLSHVNQNIWKGVLLAMVFSIPMKKVLRCKKSILKKDYLPSVNAVNNSIWIRINELTTKQDIRLIWKEVEEKQRECIEKYQYLEPGRKYRNRV
ncbi:MAG: hypothetical protein L6275_00350, partial [Candidatus Portnoybacteria bacterium]|nr:hypothetical protein [Candidatus Portnoybacteria bacterium]